MSSTLPPRRPDWRRPVRLRRRFSDAVAVATLVVVTLGASTAAARRPPGEPPEGPPDDPPPTTVVDEPSATPPATTAPPSTIPRQVRSFIVTADSVVATAELAYAGAPATLIVYWGDNTATELTPPPPGSVVVRHEYAPEPGGRPFDRIVTANIAGESDARSLRVTPRYLVRQDEASFMSMDDCEPFYEDESEWQIDRHEVSVGGVLVADAASWDSTRPTNVSPSYYSRLDGSAVRAELTAAQVMYISYRVVEDDGLSDDVAGTRWFTIQPDGFVGNEWNHLTFNDDSDCEARISAYIWQSLVRPGL